MAFTKLDRLKRKARKQYLAYVNARPDLDCGVAMAEMIDPNITRYKLGFNKTLAEIKKLDPECNIEPL